MPLDQPTITRLGQIVEVAVEREMTPRNSARVGGKRRNLKPRRPDRTYFDRADQIESMLDAAGELDRTGRGPRVRRPLLATLIFAGLRLGEALTVGATSTWPKDNCEWSTPNGRKAPSLPERPVIVRNPW